MILSISYLHAQKELYNWYYQKEAMSFLPDGKEPVFLYDSELQDGSFEGCASISDKNGKLLFYTDGHHVWNGEHKLMLNWEGIKGAKSSCMSSMIIKQPYSDNIYYLFTTGHNYEDAHLGDARDPSWYYHIIDMSLDNGLGAVKKKY